MLHSPAASVLLDSSIQFPLPPTTMPMALLYVIIFGLVGILLTVFGFKVFDWMTPRINVETELAEKNNIAVAIVVAAIIIGVSIVVAAAVG